ncbi:hypothetical protein E4V51_13585 [Paenibacillus sp. 28ISP30-2]|nr:hypothetical protein [Paenibacillus sp. 28ISP30-2]
MNEKHLNMLKLIKRIEDEEDRLCTFGDIKRHSDENEEELVRILKDLLNLEFIESPLTNDLQVEVDYNFVRFKIHQPGHVLILSN